MDVDSRRFKRILFFIYILIGLSIFLSFYLSMILSFYNIKIPFYINIPLSAPGIFFVVFGIFNKYLWKLKIFSKLGVISVNDLNGEWQGYINSSNDDFNKKIKTMLNIKQNATTIKINAFFEHSKSISIHESFAYSELDQSTALYYFYRSVPNTDTTLDISVHEGAGKLVYNSKKDTLEGYYYSGRGDNDFGKMVVKRVKGG